jgi:hypothetical protein
MVSTNGALVFGGKQFGSTNSIRTQELLVNHREKNERFRRI